MKHNKTIFPDLDLCTKLQLLGNIAILVDEQANQTNIATNNYEDLIKFMQNLGINPKVIMVNTEGSNLTNPEVWQAVDRVLIALSANNPLAAGRIQAILDVLDLAYTGSGMLAAALSNDLIKCKKLWQRLGIATTPFIVWHDNIDWQEVLGFLGLPMAVRSANLQEPQIFKVTHLDQVASIAHNFNKIYDLILEPWITGDLYMVFILADRALDPINIHHKLEDPALLNSQLSYNSNLMAMKKLAEDAFLAIGGQGYGLVKILQDLNGDCWVLSVNTNIELGLESHLMQAAANIKLDFGMVIDQVLATSLVKRLYKYNTINNSNKIISDN